MHSRTTARLASSLVAVAALAGCDVTVKGDDAAQRPKQDTTVVAPTVSASQLPGARDSVAGVPAVPTDSAAALAAAADTGVLELYPPLPRRGGVLFAFARGLAVSAPRCTWKGAALPCYAADGGVVATVPLPSDDSAGTFALTIDRPNGRITRQVAVADRDFGRELVFLDRDRYALVTRSADIARDARALRGVLAGETPTRQWRGRWKDPVSGGQSSGFGIERFYYPASDSSRAITLDASRHARGLFGSDTLAAPSGEAPSWRHAGADLAVRRGTTITAPAAGTVADLGDYTLSGRTLLLDHGQGVFTAYFHLDSAFVRRGDTVRQGERLGRVGETGLTTGPHLHYGIYVHGRAVEPASWRDMPATLTGADTARR